MRLLDVGCGWGSLILHAAEHYGVHATGITLSAQQRDLIAKRIADRGLADRVEVRLQDYREFDEPPADVRRGQLDRDGRARRRGAVPGLRRRSCSARSSRADGCCCSRCRATPAPRPAAARSSSPTSRRTCTCGRCAQTARPPRERRLRGARRRGDARALRPHRRRTGSTRSRRAGTSSSRCMGEEVARVWRLYLVGGALSFEEGRMGVDQFLAVQADRGRRERRCRRPGRGRSVPTSDVSCVSTARRSPPTWSGRALRRPRRAARDLRRVARSRGKHSVIDTAWGLLFVRRRGRRRSSRRPGTATTLRRVAAARPAGAVGTAAGACTSAGASIGKPEDPRYEQLLAKAKGNPRPVRAAHRSTCCRACSRS